MKMFVSSPEAGDPLMDPTDFERALRARWPDARLHHSAHPDALHAFDWHVEMSHGVMVGSFGKDGETLVCDGDVGDCAEVATWYRSLVPLDRPLLFYDEAFSASVEMRQGMTLDELVQPFAD
jgi:hypothetical protein